jgi:glycosyltransferase involved in cell wall biosynthesis
LHSAEAQPLISVIVPARNEQENIGDCVRSLLTQGEGIEIIVADDSSTDHTAPIVQGIARESPNVRLVSVPPLPEEWLGKNHALHAAVPHAHGEWLLFTDADTRHQEAALRGVVNWAEKAKLDLVSCSPPQQTETWWEQAVIPQVYQMLAGLYPFERVNDPSDPLAAANGQFILIRRPVYERLGGHAAIRNEMLEDVALAQRAKRYGFRIWFGPGDGIVRTRMYRTFGAMWEGWTKNLFLLFRRDRRAMWRAAAVLALRSWVPVVAAVLPLGAGFPAAWLGFGLLAFSLSEHIRYAHKLRPPNKIKVAALMVPGALIVFLLLLNSERRYSRKRGIEWKGRRYPAGN